MQYNLDGFAQRLKKIRTNCGYTQQQMADALSVHRTTYTYYETGRSNPPRDVINKLVKIFNISYDDLLATEIPNRTNRLRSPEATAEADKLYNLSKQERNLLLALRMMNDEERKNVLDVVQNIFSQRSKNAASTEKKDKN